MKISNQISTLILIIILSLQEVLCKDTLKYIGSQFRHGARGPLYQVLNWNSTYNVYYSGQLTATGQRQHFVLGQTLRERYITGDKFGLGLKEEYDHNQIYVRSSDVVRTLDSASAQLIGLYPPGTGPFLAKDLPEYLPVAPYKGAEAQKFGSQALPFQSQNIPVHNYPEQGDMLLRASKISNCPAFVDLYLEYVNGPEGQEYIRRVNTEYAVQLQKLTDFFGFEVQLYNIESLFDVLTSDKYNGQHTDNWDQITPDMWDTINTLDDYWWPIYWVNPKMCIVIASRNMKAWVDYSDIVLGNMELDDKHKALKEIKYTMYSGHDENLFALQAAFNVTNFDCLWKLYHDTLGEGEQCVKRPGFAAVMIYELYLPEYVENAPLNERGEDPNEPYIKVLHDGKYINLCGEQYDTCTLENFRLAVENYMYVDPKAQNKQLRADVICKVENNDNKNQKQYSVLEEHAMFINQLEQDHHKIIEEQLYYYFGTVLCLLIIGCIGYYLHSKRKQQLKQLNEESQECQLTKYSQTV